VAEAAPFSARRILVAIDASSASLDALAAATAITVRLGGELAGLFVEDEDLLRLASLPFGDIVRTPGGERERLDRDSAEASLRALAARAREALERTAAAAGLHCTFRVARGRVAREVVAAAAGADLVVLGASSHGRWARSAIGETARAAAARAPSSVLLLPRGARVEGGVVAVDDGAGAARALAAARRLAPADRPPVVASAPDGGAAELAETIARLAPALAVVAATGPSAEAGLPERLLAAGVPVMLVR
jgi:nucleotide-binding universal stress UspA family protein